MALNITFDGFAYDKNSSICNADVKYQAFFYQNGTASSPDTWNDVRTVEASGYYSVNLGDADFLGQEGSALSNAIVLIVYWRGTPLGDDRNALCSILEEWGAFEITLDGSAVYTNDAQVKDNIIPVLQWNHDVPAHGYVDTTYNTTNTSYDVHYWDFDGIATSGTVEMNHWRTRYGEDIQLINTVDGSNYFWGDTTSDLDLPGAAGTSHQWTTAGQYTIEAQSYDTCSGTASGTDTVNIYWHAPVPGITRCQSNGTHIGGSAIYPPDTEVFFTYDGTDIDNAITSITWTIADSGAYGTTPTTTSGVTSSGVVDHTNGLGTSWPGHAATPGAFTNPGTHNVAISVYWWDGFTTQVENYNENFTQQTFTGPPIPDIDCNEDNGSNQIITPDTAVSFDYNGSNPDSRILYIDWTIYDSGAYGNTDTTTTGVVYDSIVYHTEGLGTSWPTHTATSGAFTNPGVHNVDIDIYWNDGYSTYKVDYDENFTQFRFNGPPTPDINCNEDNVSNQIVTPDTTVSFDYVGDNPDSRILYIDWTIADTGAYGNTTTTISGEIYTNTVYHTAGSGTDWCSHSGTAGAFTNPGTHNVNADVVWNDGWDTSTESYDDDFYQLRYTGPTVDFTQSPPQAVVGSGISFINNSSSTSRVGLGLPDCKEYDWELDDDGILTTAIDKPFSYDFDVTPTTDNCSVELCAEYSDGWDTQRTCDTDTVVFETTVSISEVDCYYNLHIIGTSDDGTTTGYSWDIYKDSTCSGTCLSGTSGSWDLVWTSPTGIGENDKTIAFTEACCYRIYGYVHGTGATTNDYEDLYVSLADICTTVSGAPCVCSGIGLTPDYGRIQIENGWQLVSVPIENGYWDAGSHVHVHDDITTAKFKNYVLDQIEDLYGTGRIEVANTYTGDNQFFYSYVVGSTPESSPHNFQMVYDDSGYAEISGWWIKSTYSGTMLISWGE